MVTIHKSEPTELACSCLRPLSGRSITERYGVDKINPSALKGCAILATVILGVPLLVVGVVGVKTWIPLQEAGDALARARIASGAGGRELESARPDHKAIWPDPLWIRFLNPYRNSAFKLPQDSFSVATTLVLMPNTGMA